MQSSRGRSRVSREPGRWTISAECGLRGAGERGLSGTALVLTHSKNSWQDRKEYHRHRQYLRRAHAVLVAVWALPVVQEQQHPHPPLPEHLAPPRQRLCHARRRRQCHPHPHHRHHCRPRTTPVSALLCRTTTCKQQRTKATGRRQRQSLGSQTRRPRTPPRNSVVRRPFSCHTCMQTNITPAAGPPAPTAGA